MVVKVKVKVNDKTVTSAMEKNQENPNVVVQKEFQALYDKMQLANHRETLRHFFGLLPKT